MNYFASLEDILSPIGEPKAPIVGLLVQDWDENVTLTAGRIAELGYAAQVLPLGAQVSQEQNASNNGIVPDNEVTRDPQPQVLFYYKGKPENAAEGIPVLVINEGKVKVSIEERLIELREHLTAIGVNPRVDGDHEFR
jgi:hypothetical protein